MESDTGQEETEAGGDFKTAARAFQALGPERAALRADVHGIAFSIIATVHSLRAQPRARSWPCLSPYAWLTQDAQELFLNEWK